MGAIKINPVNAQQMALKYPETFEVPSNDELDSITKNDFVKICMSNERFWCQVIEVKIDVIIGRVDNQLVLAHTIEHNSIVEFNKCNVYSILKGK